MSKEAPPDPADTFRETLTRWERGFDSLANQIMGTEGYSRSMNQMQDMQLGMQKLYKDFMTQNLNNANMPSRDDLLRVAESIQELNRRMTRIEALLENVLEDILPSKGQNTPEQRKGPPRTRKPPSTPRAGSSGRPIERNPT